jgi:hypothetical protein
MEQPYAAEVPTPRAKLVICTQCHRPWTVTALVTESFVCQTCRRNRPTTASFGSAAAYACGIAPICRMKDIMSKY